MSLSHGSDHDAVRDYLESWGDAAWSKPENQAYVDRVVSFMDSLRVEYPNRVYPYPTHGADDIGACEECDALRVLHMVDEEPEDA